MRALGFVSSNRAHTSELHSAFLEAATRHLAFIPMSSIAHQCVDGRAGQGGHRRHVAQSEESGQRGVTGLRRVDGVGFVDMMPGLIRQAGEPPANRPTERVPQFIVTY